jgi:hypothetical protein
MDDSRWLNELLGLRGGGGGGGAFAKKIEVFISADGTSPVPAAKKNP